ncbi:MAG: hypothetical protein LBJ20_02535 [Candidatus Methanoplasma sp.]|jgi:hypothetical protein|nr:hypothetical protein [Candidatus Methanoplasma sp.]
MSEVTEAAGGFMRVCGEVAVKPMPRRTDIAIRSKIELPSTYIDLNADDIEYVTGEGFSSQVEVGRYYSGSSSYESGFWYLMNEAGINIVGGAMLTVDGVALGFIGALPGYAALGPMGAALGVAAATIGIYGLVMQRDANLRAGEAHNFIVAGQNYKVTNNYTLFGALHNGYGCYAL